MPRSKASQTLLNALAVQISIFTLVFGALASRPLTACDVCLRAPRAPFKIDCIAALEVAIATREAIDGGNIDSNPLLDESMSLDRHGRLHLGDISEQQLVQRWIHSRAAQKHSASRVTVDILFVESGATYRIDFRCGRAIVAVDRDGPADARLVTSKTGFYQLLFRGLEFSSEHRLVHVELEAEETATAFQLAFRND